MKKAVCVVAVALSAITTFAALKFSSAPIPAQNKNNVSERASKALQAKIDTIKAAEKGNGHGRVVEASEQELESYVIYGMKDDIPAKVESIAVQLTEGAVAADTRLTLPPDATGNVIVDAFVSGTHTFFLKGKLSATDGIGRFELLDVKVDGIPVPNILIETLIAKYVKPKYPEVDLKEPFPMPWGMETLTITRGKVTVTY